MPPVQKNHSKNSRQKDFEGFILTPKKRPRKLKGNSLFQKNNLVPAVSKVWVSLEHTHTHQIAGL